MKVAVIICTYNRPDYLKQCLDSIEQSFIPEGVHFYIVDDASEDTKVYLLIDDFLKRNTNSTIILNDKKGIHGSLLIGVKAAMQDKCDTFINIDGDAIVSKDWLTVLIALHKRNIHTIVSGFNTLSCDYHTKKSRHPVIHEYGDFVLKKSIGGINMCFNKRIYFGYIEKNLINNWDWNVCREMRKRDNYFVVSKPSVIQHIGVEGMHNLNPDISHDFKE
jgi:glycosyltransferase involved in cell wall biosynthesis